MRRAGVFAQPGADCVDVGVGGKLATGTWRSIAAGAAIKRRNTGVGERAYVFALAYSKTNQTGTDRPDNDKPIVGVAAAALEAWLAASGIRSGAIFRRIRRGNKLGEPLSSAAVRDIVKQRALLAGIPGDFSAHSLRSGFVTEAARQGVPLGETMAMTGHASVPTVLGYFRTGSRLESTAAKLMDRKRPV